LVIFLLLLAAGKWSAELEVSMDEQKDLSRLTG
jgi:hypothetical protein